MTVEPSNKTRVNRGGNFCGHDPHAPKFPQVINALLEGKLHPLQKAAISNLKGYYRSPSMLSMLGRIKANGELRTRRKNGEFRKVRTDRADPIISVLAYLISKVNLVKLQVGIIPYHDPDGLIGAPTQASIAAALGETEGRVYKALAHLKNAGYITITQRRQPKKDGDGWESLPAIICIKNTVFVLAGISKAWLKRTRDWKYQEWKKERNRRFQRSIERDRERHQAKQKEAHDFFMQDLMRKVQDLEKNQKGWLERQNADPDPPPIAH